MSRSTRLYDFFQPSSYVLNLDLSNVEERVYKGTVTITGTPQVDSKLRLHAKDLGIDSVRVGTKKPKTSLCGDEVILESDAIISGQSLIVELSFHGVISDSMHGLYPCYYTEEGKSKTLFATQLESHYAREVFPCIDEPEAKATFDLTIIAASTITVLSNTPCISSKTHATKTTHHFEPSPIMSTYLLAFVLGEMHSVTATSKNGTVVNVWSTKDHSTEALQWGTTIGVVTIDFFEEYFQTPYPLAKCDHVALPDFAAGAMENWGLITYRETCLIADETTSLSHKRYIATVIAHEVAHQWFGNLVTMRWWDELWLNESFANVMQYVALDSLFPEWSIWDDFAIDEIYLALQRDKFSATQPVMCTIDDPEEIAGAFDKAIVYAKGSRLIRMAIDIAGEDAFRQGLRNYFKQYAYQNTVGQQLWDQISTVAGRDIAQFMNQWLKQPGYPLVTAETNNLQSVISQQRFSSIPSTSLWPVAVHVSGVEKRHIVQNESSTTYPSLDGKSPVINPNALHHYLTKYDDEYFDAILTNVTHTTIPEKLDLLYGAMLLCQRNHHDAQRIIKLLSVYSNLDNEHIWRGIELALTLLKTLVHEKHQPHFNSYVQGLVRPHFINDESSNSTHAVKAPMLSLLVESKDPEILAGIARQYEKGNFFDTTPADIRFASLKGCVAIFAEAQMNELYDLYLCTNDATLRDELIKALATTTNLSLIHSIVNALGDPKIIRPQDLPRVFGYLMKNDRAQESTWRWLESHWSYVLNYFETDFSLDRFPQYAAAGLEGETWYQRYETFFTPRSVPSMERSIAIGLEDIKERTYWISQQRESFTQIIELGRDTME
jgi:aminopeptidase N